MNHHELQIRMRDGHKRHAMVTRLLFALLNGESVQIAARTENEAEAIFDEVRATAKRLGLSLPGRKE